MKKLEYYLTLDRGQNLRVRKNAWKLDDGELRIKLIVNIPISFFSTPQIEAVAEISIPEQELPIPIVETISHPILSVESK